MAVDFLDTTALGGLPFVLDDIRWDNDAERDVLLKICEAFSIVGTTKFKVSGCVVTTGGGNVTTTAGLIYLDSQLVRVEAHSVTDLTGTYSFYIVATDDPGGSKEFQNGVTNETYKKYRGILHKYTGALPADELASDADNIMDNIKFYIGVSTTSNSGTISIASSAETQAQVVNDKAIVPSNLIASTSQKGIVEFATNTETQSGASSSLAITPSGIYSILTGLKAIPFIITTWDMQGTASYNVTTGITDLYTRVYSIEVLIRRDSIANRFDTFSYAGTYSIDTTTGVVSLNRDAGGIFDSTTYNDGSFNPRGRGVIWYI